MLKSVLSVESVSVDGHSLSARSSARGVGCWLGRGPCLGPGTPASVARMVRRPITWHIRVHIQSKSFRVDAPIMGHITPRSEKWTQNGAGHFGTAPCCPPDNKQKIFGISSCWKWVGWCLLVLVFLEENSMTLLLHLPHEWVSLYWLQAPTHDF